jgi:hypothetical protein
VNKGSAAVAMEKIEIRHNQVYRLAIRHRRWPTRLAALLRRLLHKRL